MGNVVVWCRSLPGAPRRVVSKNEATSTDLMSRACLRAARLTRLYTVFDRAKDHYLVMAVAWDGTQRVLAPLLHVDIVDDKIWVQHDGTESGIAKDFVAGGVPRESIVLAFKHPSRRKYTDYAAA